MRRKGLGPAAVAAARSADGAAFASVRDRRREAKAAREVQVQLRNQLAESNKLRANEAARFEESWKKLEQQRGTTASFALAATRASRAATATASAQAAERAPAN